MSFRRATKNGRSALATVRPRLFVLLAALAALTVLAAVNAGAQETRIAACLFPTVGLSAGEETGRLSEIVNRALEQNLRQLGIEILPESAWKEALGGAEPDGRAAAEAAAAAGARMAVVSVVNLQDRQLAMAVKVLDARSGRLVSSVYSTTLVGVAIHNRITEAVDRLTPQLESFIKPEQETADVAPFVIEAVLLSSQEGLRISLGGIEPVGEIAGGRLALPFALYPIGTRMDLVEEKAGYHAGRETVVLDRPRSEVRLQELWPETRRSIHFMWTTGQVLGLGVGYRHYLRPDYLFLAGENYLYLQPAAGDASGIAIHDDLGFLIGRYLLSRHDAPIRFSLAAGLGVILTKNRIPGLFTDFYLDAMSLNLEWNLRQYTVALRSDLKITLGIGNDLLGGELLRMQRFGPQITVGVGRKL